MHETRWRAIERALARTPRYDETSIDRVMDRVLRPESKSESKPGRAWGGAVLRVALAAGIVALSFVGYGIARRRTLPGAGTVSPSVAPTHRDVQFMYVSAGANRVALVGDFNDWNPEAAPLRRSGSAVWSAVVPLTPGRHVYAFVVDGKTWVPDSSAPRAPENEYGQSNSVAFVGGGT